MNKKEINLIQNTISESIIIPQIKYLYFSPEEIEKYKDENEIFILRPISKNNGLALNDYLKPDWGKIYKIEDVQYFNELEDYPYLNLLNKTEILELGKLTESFIMFKLVRVVKRNVQRFFYDCEFDESPEYGIKLISIGIVDENGNELYLINNDYDWSTCTNKWLIKNVKPYIQQAPAFYKMSTTDMIRRILNFIKPTLDKDVKLYRLLFRI